MKKYNLRTALSALPALPAQNGADSAGNADTAGIAVRRCRTEREVLDEVRQVFPNAKFWREPPLDLVVKECLICGRVCYSRSGAESEYCGNECASIGHRRYVNPSRERVRFLRQQCRASWERATENADASDDFVMWLYHLEKRLARMRGDRFMVQRNGETIEVEFPSFEEWVALNLWIQDFNSGKLQSWRREQEDAYWASAIGRLRKQAESGSEKSA